MRLSSHLIAACAWQAVASLAASTPAARVYLLDQAPTSNGGSSVTPETARSIFVERLGLSHLYSLGTTDPEVLGQINDFSGKGQQLFGGDVLSEKALVIFEGVEDITGIDAATFTIQNAPHPEANEQLIAQLWSQSQSLETPGPSDKLIDLFAKFAKADNGCRTHLRGHNGVHLVVAQCQNNKETSDVVRREIQSWRQSIHNEPSSIAVALMPPRRASDKILSTNPYNIQSLLVNTKRQTKEAPLEMLEEAESTSGVNVVISPGLPLTLATGNSSAPLPGIFPSCFSSLSTCQSTTRNCTGHGECVLKYRDPDNDDRACYSCACTKPDVRTNPDGTSKTTHYGGPACQKKDVSMPFWLLAGFTVTLMFVISWAVGLLYSMGEEELPSVIGAGVSGPRAK